ncbi:MAG: hemin receptor [Caldilinea sp. CFX5]|nr:hemin receptor [Caldilinea sp. CFX5]
MKPETITLVQQSWQSIAPIAPQAAELFYQNLFAADPSLKALFHSDMRDQGHKLMKIIGAAVNKLDDTATLLPIVTALGRRHAGYGVQAAHYQTVGAALLTTLGQGLGDAFTPAVKDAWSEVYGLLAEIMVAAAVDMEAVTEVSNKEHDYVYSE